MVSKTLLKRKLLDFILRVWSIYSTHLGLVLVGKARETNTTNTAAQAAVARIMSVIFPSVKFAELAANVVVKSVISPNFVFWSDTRYRTTITPLITSEAAITVINVTIRET